MLRALFEVGQRVGVDVLPRHFYSEIPDIAELARSRSWRSPFSMYGVEGCDLDEQMALVRGCCTPEIVRQLKAMDVHGLACARNGAEGYGKAEAEFLYSVVRTSRPAEIFQIGCGVSTAVCLMAADAAGYKPEITCIEPYPTPFLTREAAAGRIVLDRMKAEALDLGRIERLGSNVLFFVDSTHRLGPAGEVSRIVLEMVPRLKPGAWVHFHDILFPYDYDRHIMDSALFFQHESALLHSFLLYNSRFRIAASLSMLHYSRAAELMQSLPGYVPAKNDDGLHQGEGMFPSSTYLIAS